MIKLSELSTCLPYSAFYVNSVVCYHSVTRNSNNISGYVYNREFITHLTPISQILNLTISCFSQTHVSGNVIKTKMVSIICVTFILESCKVSLLNYLLLFLNLEKGP